MLIDASCTIKRNEFYDPYDVPYISDDFVTMESDNLQTIFIIDTKLTGFITYQSGHGLRGALELQIKNSRAPLAIIIKMNHGALELKIRNELKGATSGQNKN